MTKHDFEDYMDSIEAADDVEELKNVLRDLLWDIYKLSNEQDVSRVKLKDLYNGIDDAKYNIEQAQYILNNLIKKVNQDILNADDEVISELEYIRELFAELV